MKRKELYTPPVAESIALNTIHSILDNSGNRGNAGGEEASFVDGEW